MVTIVGPGGIGKTRLAIETAQQVKDLFPDGTWFVPLAPLNSPTLIIPTIVDAVDFKFSDPTNHQAQLLRYLLPKRALLLLDNAEHLLDGEGVFTEILKHCPQVKLLVTSREQLNLLSEWVFEVQGLPVPTNEQLEQMEASSSVALFLQSARRVRAGFALRQEERPWVRNICQTMEGMPLGIELAAAWVGILSISEISREIASNLDFLTTTMRDIPERHRSLRAAIDHSWNLLSSQERQVLYRLAVFQGGFQREAAEQTAGASLPILLSLYSKSLVSRQMDGRYDLHEVIRQYLLPYLRHDSQYKIILERYCAFYLGLVQTNEQDLEGADQYTTIQLLRKELDNLRMAMSWSLLQGEPLCALQIATGLGQFWISQCYWREGLDWLNRGLTSPKPIPDVVKAKALNMAGWLYCLLGELAREVALLREDLDLWRQIGDPCGIALTLCHLGAEEILTEALHLSNQEDYLFGIRYSQEALGRVASRQGNSIKAIELYQEALIGTRKVNNKSQIANLLNKIGDDYLILGDFDRAEEYFRQAAPICQKLGDRIVGAYIGGNRGWIAMKKGNYPLAIYWIVGSSLVLNEVGEIESVILSFEPLAFIANELGFPEMAARLLGASETLRQMIGISRSRPNQEDFEEYIACVQSQLGRAAFETAWAEGSAMSYDQAVAYASDKTFPQSQHSTKIHPKNDLHGKPITAQ